MRSVFIGGIAAVFIAILAGAVLSNLNESSSERFATSNARI